MVLTVLLSLMMSAGLFLLLYAGVALIQNKKYFTSAPKEVFEAILPKEQRFRGQHMLGCIMAALAVFCMGGALVIGAADGITNGFTFGRFFARFLVMLLWLKAFDILFFDWYVLCRSGFFPRYYPEVKDVLGPHLFGFNKKDHLKQIIACFIAAAVMAWLCTLL